MNLDEWEILPKNSFKDLDHGEMMLDYDLCASSQDPLHKPESPKISRVVPPELLQVPIAWEPVMDHHENKKIATNQDLEADSDPDSKQNLMMDSVPSPRVSFKKTKETEFVDMKTDTPVRITSPKPQIDVIAKALGSEDDLREKKENDDVINDHGGEKLNLWKVGLNGIGAICSFGAAAAVASVCVFFLGHNNIKVSKNKNQMLGFQIYSDDNKRMKEVVNHATKLNETIFAMKGGPAVRAQISFGGYYDGV